MLKIRSLFLMQIVLLCLLLLPAQATAGETEFEVGLGSYVSSSPYKGYSTTWAPIPHISYESDYAYIRGFRGGVKLLNLESLELSAYGEYNGLEFKHKDSTRNKMRKLDNRDSTALAGLDARLQTPIGMLYANVGGDVLGTSNGFTGSAGYNLSFALGKVIDIFPMAGVYWNSAKYNTYYYGVRSKESRKSGLKKYDAGHSYSPYIGLSVDINFTDNCYLFLHGEMTFLDSQIRNSPMVDTRHTQSLTTGLMYEF